MYDYRTLLSWSIKLVISKSKRAGVTFPNTRCEILDESFSRLSSYEASAGQEEIPTNDFSTIQIYNIILKNYCCCLQSRQGPNISRAEYYGCTRQKEIRRIRSYKTRRNRFELDGSVKHNRRKRKRYNKFWKIS